MTRDGFAPGRQSFRRAAQASYLGQSSEIDVPLPDGDISGAMIATLFAEQHERIYGFRAPPEEQVELIGSVRHGAWAAGPAAPAGAYSGDGRRGAGDAACVVSRRQLDRNAGRRPCRALHWRPEMAHSSCRSTMPPVWFHAARAHGLTILAMS